MKSKNFGNAPNWQFTILEILPQKMPPMPLSRDELQESGRQTNFNGRQFCCKSLKRPGLVNLSIDTLFLPA